MELDPDGTFTLAWTTAPVTFDPHVGPENLHYPFTAPVYDRLVRLRTDGTLAPMLATRWRFADGGSRLELDLRRDVAFHDGTPFDAQAVRANLDRGRSSAASQVVRDQLGPITDTIVVDDHRIVFELGDGAGALPAYLATASGMMASPVAFDDPAFDLNPVGTGAYVLDPQRFVPGERATYTRAPGGHWDPGTGRVREFTLAGIRDNDARLDALFAGEADIVDFRGSAVSRALAAAETGEYDLVSYPSTTTIAIQFNRARPELGDLRVRRALNLAIDRGRICTELLAGRGVPIVQTLPADDPGHDPSLDDYYPYDPDRARDLLASAGVAGLELTALQFADLEPMTSLLAMVRDQLEQVGVHLDLHPKPPPELVAAWHAGRFDVRSTFASSLPMPALMLHRRLNPTQNPGDLAAFSAELPALAGRLLDQRMPADRARELCRDVNRLMVEDAVMAEVCRTQTDILARSTVAGIDDIPYAALHLYDVANLAVAKR